MAGPHEHSAVKGSPHPHRSAQIQRSRPLSSSLGAHDHSPCANPPPSCASSASRPASHPSLLPLPSLLYPFSCSSGLGQFMLLCTSIHPSQHSPMCPLLCGQPSQPLHGVSGHQGPEGQTPGPEGAQRSRRRGPEQGSLAPGGTDTRARRAGCWGLEGWTPGPGRAWRGRYQNRGADTRAWSGGHRDLDGQTLGPERPGGADAVAQRGGHLWSMAL